MKWNSLWVCLFETDTKSISIDRKYMKFLEAPMGGERGRGNQLALSVPQNGSQA